MKTFGLLFLGLIACGGDTGSDTDFGTHDSDIDDIVDDLDSDSDSDVPTPVEYVNLAEALGDCGGSFDEPDAYPNQLSSGTALRRLTLEAENAVCNDGTPAVLYVRPAAEGSPHANRWVLHTQGGSGCRDFESCAIRWCGSEYYDASKMSSTYAPEAVGGIGIHSTLQDNTFADFNHAYFYYCSSDSWAGQGTSVLYPPDDLEVTVPEAAEDGVLIERRGHDIIVAALEELRSGTAVSDDGTAEMPDLDDASTVIWSGTSAGSSGASRHLDWVADQLSVNGTQVVGLFDAAIGPNLQVLNDESLELALQARWVAQQVDPLVQTDHDKFVDESCAALNTGVEGWRCANSEHYLYHHITTPFFVRMDLTDDKYLEKYAPQIWGTDTGSYDVDVLAELMAQSLESLGELPATAEEGAAMIGPPAWYGPRCGQHVGIESANVFLNTTIWDGEQEVSCNDAMASWLQGEFTGLADPDGELSECSN